MLDYDRRTLAGKPVGPGDEDALNREAHVHEPGRAHISIVVGLRGHVEMDQEEDEELRDDAPRADGRQPRNRQQDARQDLGHATELHEQGVRGKKVRHDREVEVRVEKMIYAACDEEEHQQIFESQFYVTHVSLLGVAVRIASSHCAKDSRTPSVSSCPPS